MPLLLESWSQPQVALSRAERFQGCFLDGRRSTFKSLLLPCWLATVTLAFTIGALQVCQPCRQQARAASRLLLFAGRTEQFTPGTCKEMLTRTAGLHPRPLECVPSKTHALRSRVAQGRCGSQQVGWIHGGWPWTRAHSPLQSTWISELLRPGACPLPRGRPQVAAQQSWPRLLLQVLDAG